MDHESGRTAGISWAKRATADQIGNMNDFLESPDGRLHAADGPTYSARFALAIIGGDEELIGTPADFWQDVGCTDPGGPSAAWLAAFVRGVHDQVDFDEFGGPDPDAKASWN